MKKLTCIFIALVILTACKKNDQLPGNNGCITQIKRQNFNIKSSDSIAAIQLLKQNNIPYNNVQLEYFSSNIVPSNQSNAGDAYASVFVIQQINGLPILSGELWYQFTNSVLQTTSGTRYNEINLSNSSSLQLAPIRAAYIAEVAKNNSTLSTQL